MSIFFSKNDTNYQKNEAKNCRYYLNGGDAYRLKLYFTPPSMNSVINRRSSQVTIDDRCSVSSE